MFKNIKYFLRSAIFVSLILSTFLMTLFTFAPASTQAADWSVAHEIVPAKLLDLEDVFMADATHGWAAGSNMSTNRGVIYRTTDGTSWEPVLDSGTDFIAFNGIHMTSLTTGWAVGYSSLTSAGVIYNTTDGTSWSAVSLSGNENKVFYSVYMASATNGLAVGYDSATMAGIVWQTTNGSDWSQILDSGTMTEFYDVAMTDADHAWVVGYNQDWSRGIVYITDNGGASWGSFTTAEMADVSLRGIDMVDPLNGWAAGYGNSTRFGEIFRTVDGGVNWTEVCRADSAQYIFSEIYMADALRGWVVGRDDNNRCGVVFTTDNGTIWSQTAATTDDINFYGVHGTSNTQAWVTGGDRMHQKGVFYRTVNATDWAETDSTSGSTLSLYDVSLPSANCGYAAGYDMTNNRGSIYRTTDGTDWLEVFNTGSNPIPFSGLDMLDDTHGFAAGGFAAGLDQTGSVGVIYRTTTGTDWQEVERTTDPVDLQDIKMASSTNGWACGYDTDISRTCGVIYSTSNGTDWTEAYHTAIGNKAIIYGLSIVDAAHVYAAGISAGGQYGEIHRTIDGTNWSSVYTTDPVNASFQSIYMLDSIHGWAAGSTSGLFGSSGVIYKTTNGTDWAEVANTGMADVTFFDVFMVDANHGWAAGTVTGPFSAPGVIYKTTNGTDWAEEYSASDYKIYGLDMLSATSGAACGDQRIYKYGGGGGSTFDNTYADASTGNDTLYDGGSATISGSHGPKKKISAALAVTNAGGTCHIAAGTYLENISLTSVKNLAGADSVTTIIDGSGGGSCVTITGVSSRVTVSGLTLTGGTGTAGYGGGLYIKNSVVTLNDCVVKENSATIGGGLIIWEETSCDVTISNCQIIGNSATTVGGLSSSGSSISSSSNGNRSFHALDEPSGFSGAILAMGNVNLTIIRTEISDNSAENAAGGIFFVDTMDPEHNPAATCSLTVTNCTFARNGDSGIAILKQKEESAVSGIVKNTIFIDHTIPSSMLTDPAGLLAGKRSDVATGPSMTVDYCDFFGNTHDLAHTLMSGGSFSIIFGTYDSVTGTFTWPAGQEPDPLWSWGGKGFLVGVDPIFTTGVPPVGQAGASTDYLLSAGSPCRNAGDPASPADQRDMGAYQYQNPTPRPDHLSVVINGGADYTNNCTVTLAIGARYATQMKISGDVEGSGTGIWIRYATSATVDLTSGDGEKTVKVDFRGAGGSAGPATDTIYLATTGPDPKGITLKNAATGSTQYTNTLPVKVEVGPEITALFAAQSIPVPTVDQMIFSQNPDFSGASWQAYAASADFTLTSGDGNKTVYAKFKDQAGNESTITSASILLDTVPPVAPANVRTARGTVIESGDPIGRGDIELKTTLTDSGSGVDEPTISLGFTPVLGLLSQPGNSWKQTINITYDPATGLMTYTSDELAAGRYDLTIGCSDKAGNAMVPFTLGLLEVLAADSAMGLFAGTTPVVVRTGDGAYSITYSLTDDLPINIRIYDLSGALIWQKEIAAGAEGGALGYNSVIWDGRNAFGAESPRGIYIIRLISSGKLIGTIRFAKI